MSLLTPPHTTQRDKENRTLSIPTTSRIVWAKTHDVQILDYSALVQTPVKSNDFQTYFPKSILKEPSSDFAPLPQITPREVTPEPSDPLADSDYLRNSIERLISLESSLRDLVESYSILTARLVACIGRKTDPNVEWPLLQPFREHKVELAQAIVRDLGCALTEPMDAEEEIEERGPLSMLPSPQQSPKRKRGMTAEQAKHARDLSTTAHAVIKFLAVFLGIPALYTIFNATQLNDILTGVLGIPLCPHLPTPNARKTCALAIWLIQSQRLPADTLAKAAPRIAFALKRGLDGELGKEGKKGSANDGLKAIHELSLYQPEIFLPAFADIMPSVLEHLTSPSVALRLQACHALGGLASAVMSSPRTPHHTRIAYNVAEFIRPSSSPKKAASPLTDALVMRTIRAAIGLAEPTYVVQGPVWGLSVLSSLIVLMGPLLKEDKKASRAVGSLLSYSVIQKRSGTRSLGCLAWRCAVWAFLQPPLPIPEDEESDDERDSEEEIQSATDSFFVVAKSIPDMGTGTAFVAALLSEQYQTQDSIGRVVAILKVMMSRSDATYTEAFSILEQLTSVDSAEAWSDDKLIVSELFDVTSSLFTNDTKSLGTAISSSMECVSGSEDIRPLSVEELSRPGVIDSLFEVWQFGLRRFNLHPKNEILKSITSAWKSLLQAKGTTFVDHTETTTWSDIVLEAVDLHIEILEDDNETWWTQAPSPGSPSSQRTLQSSSPIKTIKTTVKPGTALKMKVIDEQWRTLRVIMHNDDLVDGGKKLVSCLMKNEQLLTQTGRNVREFWTSLCVRVLLSCELAVLRTFWGSSYSDDLPTWEWDWDVATRSYVWRKFACAWNDFGEISLESMSFLLALPFSEKHSWDLKGEDCTEWEKLLDKAVKQALDFGTDPMELITSLSTAIVTSFDPTFSSYSRIADVLLGHVDAENLKEVPEEFMSLINDTLHASYPPQSQSNAPLWLVRSLASFVLECPRTLLVGVLNHMQDGMCVWISDEHEALIPANKYDDSITLWENTLMALAEQDSATAVETLRPLFESCFHDQTNKPSQIYEVFNTFSQSAFAQSVPFDAWPVCVQQHLGLSAPIAPLSPEAPLPDFQEIPTNPAAPVLVDDDLFGLESPSKTSTLLASPDILSAPSTPKFHPLVLTTPAKSPFLQLFPTDPSNTPLIQLSPKRKAEYRTPPSPTTPKRRRLENKENDSPLLASPSRSRLPLASPSSPSKRRLRESLEEDRPPKRSRMDEQEDETEVEADLLMQSPRSVSPSPLPTVRRKPSLVMESVELPTLAEIRRLQSRPDSPTPRVNFFAKLSSAFQRDRKPQLTAAESDQIPSSDDDPHIGQVTPHHLASPTLLRRHTLAMASLLRSNNSLEASSDPPSSDDSAIPSSPTKLISARRKSQRTPSKGYHRKAKSFLVATPSRSNSS